MEQNLPLVAKKVWHIVRVIFLMLRKGISKNKLLADFNLMLKRGKIAGKAIQNLMFHQWSSSAGSSHRSNLSFPVYEYEFSCRDSPAYPNFRLPFDKKRFKKAGAPPTEDDIVAAAIAVVAASPALPGFGKTPLVRQLRITDSPFPLRDVEDEDNHVDEAAEKFIMKFYKDLKKQNSMAYNFGIS